MSSEQSSRDDYDGPWKAAIQRFTEPFMALLFPAVHRCIEWSLPVEFLDQELQRLSGEAELPRGIVDRLIKVHGRSSGEETWVLVHVEVQAQRDPDLPERMFIYYYRIFDRHGSPPVSLAVLADERRWRPSRYRHERWGCELKLSFPVVKLLDVGSRWSELEASDNPFAAVVMAHLKTQATRGDPEQRAHWKLWLLRWLSRRGWSRDDILELYRFIDWLMALPEELQQRHEATLRQEQGDEAMEYVTSWERRGKQEGLKEGLKEGKQEGLKEGKQEGLKEGVIQALEVRFGTVPAEVVAAVGAVGDLDRLGELLRTAIVVESLGVFADLMRKRQGQ